MNVKRPAVSTVVVFVVVLLVTAVIAVGVGLGTDGAAAIEVGDASVSKADFNDELRQWAEMAATQARTTEGAVSGDASASLATQNVYELLIDRYLDRTGERVTAADREAGAADLTGSEFRVRPKWFRDKILDRAAKFAALTRLVGEDDQGTAEVRVLRREARRTDVSVAGAYGRYLPRLVRVSVFPTPFTASTAQG